VRWLGLDPGQKRTGVALSSPDDTYAVPLRVLQHRASGPQLDVLGQLVEEFRVDGIIIGLPLSLSGSPSEQTHAVVDLARRIAAHFGVPLEMPNIAREFYADEAPVRDGERSPAATVIRPRIILWDERLSSWEAERVARPEASAGRRRSRAKPPLDAHAAAVILQSFLDDRTRTEGTATD